jgi:hypothetical protein
VLVCERNNAGLKKLSQVLSEQTSDSSAFLNATCFKYVLNCEQHFFTFRSRLTVTRFVFIVQAKNWVEELLDASFSMRSVSHERKVCGWFLYHLKFAITYCMCDTYTWQRLSMFIRDKSIFSSERMLHREFNWKNNLWSWVSSGLTPRRTDWRQTARRKVTLTLTLTLTLFPLNIGRQRRIIGGAVFYSVRVVSKEMRRLILPRTSLLRPSEHNAYGMSWTNRKVLPH